MRSLALLLILTAAPASAQVVEMFQLNTANGGTITSLGAVRFSARPMVGDIIQLANGARVRVERVGHAISPNPLQETQTRVMVTVCTTATC